MRVSKKYDGLPVFHFVAAQSWRGFGIIPCGGYRLRRRFEHFDARKRFESQLATHRRLDQTKPVEQRCQAGLVMSGRLKPCDCPEFATTSTPDSFLGSPMVSSEGACAAYFRYHSPVSNHVPGPAILDGHTVSPLYFPGGDIGSMSVYRTVNDLAVSGCFGDRLGSCRCRVGCSQENFRM